MKYLVLVASFLVLSISSVSSADHHKKGERGKMMEMKADQHMNMAEMHKSMATTHENLGKCLKANKNDRAKCKTEIDAFKKARKEKMSMHKDQKKMRKEMRKSMKDSKKAKKETAE